MAWNSRLINISKTPPETFEHFHNITKHNVIDDIVSLNVLYSVFVFFHYWLHVWQECSVHIRTYARVYMYRLKYGKNIYNYCVFLRFNLLKMSCGKCWKWHFRDPESTNFSGGESMPSIPTPRICSWICSYGKELIVWE